MKTINEHSKIMLTIGQLKKLIREASDDIPKVTAEIKRTVEKYIVHDWKMKTGERGTMSPRELYDMNKFLKGNNISIGENEVTVDGKKVAEIEHRYSNHRINLEYKELKPKVNWIDPNAIQESLEPKMYFDIKWSVIRNSDDTVMENGTAKEVCLEPGDMERKRKAIEKRYHDFLNYWYPDPQPYDFLLSVTTSKTDGIMESDEVVD